VPHEIHDKYVDDTTLTELLETRGQSSKMKNFLQQIIDWAASNDMAINFTKTKEMVIGPPSITSKIEPLTTGTVSIERVNSFKLLGVYLDDNFSWSFHIDAIVYKATRRLYFLKQLKRAGVPHAQLLHFYIAVIRPVLEYAAPVWHHLLTKTHTDQIEAIQRRALRIIYDCTCDMPYMSALYLAEISSLADRRDKLSRNFFASMLQPTSCLFSLVPEPRDLEIVSRLRSASSLPRLPTRTKKYQSFLSYALSHYQIS
jgi:hypothetical protein